MPYNPFFTFNITDEGPGLSGKFGEPEGYTTGYGGASPITVLYGPDGVFKNDSVPAFSFSAAAGSTLTVLGPGSDDINGMHGCTFDVPVGFHEIPIRKIIDASTHCTVTIYTQ